MKYNKLNLSYGLKLLSYIIFGYLRISELMAELASKLSENYIHFKVDFYGIKE